VTKLRGGFWGFVGMFSIHIVVTLRRRVHAGKRPHKYPKPPHILSAAQPFDIAINTINPFRRFKAHERGSVEIHERYE
jgi:hypothetical protein